MERLQVIVIQKLIINCDYPWFSSNIKSHRINSIDIYLWIQKYAFYQFWVLSYDIHDRHYVRSFTFILLQLIFKFRDT